MPAFNQEIAPEKWPEWFAEHRIDPIESGWRLEVFLRMRRASSLRAFQQHLLAADPNPELFHENAAAKLRRDFEAMGDDEEAIVKAAQGHGWFAFLTGEWAVMCRASAGRARRIERAWLFPRCVILLFELMIYGPGRNCCAPKLGL